jgi:hypothetical protein
MADQINISDTHLPIRVFYFRSLFLKKKEVLSRVTNLSFLSLVRQTTGRDTWRTDRPVVSALHTSTQSNTKHHKHREHAHTRAVTEKTWSRLSYVEDSPSSWSASNACVTSSYMASTSQTSKNSFFVNDTVNPSVNINFKDDAPTQPRGCY